MYIGKEIFEIYVRKFRHYW